MRAAPGPVSIMRLRRRREREDLCETKVLASGSDGLEDARAQHVVALVFGEIEF